MTDRPHAQVSERRIKAGEVRAAGLRTSRAVRPEKVADAVGDRRFVKGCNDEAVVAQHAFGALCYGRRPSASGLRFEGDRDYVSQCDHDFVSDLHVFEISRIGDADSLDAAATRCGISEHACTTPTSFAKHSATTSVPGKFSPKRRRIESHS